MYYDATQALKCFHVGAMIWQQPWEVKTDGRIDPLLLKCHWPRFRTSVFPQPHLNNFIFIYFGLRDDALESFRWYFKMANAVWWRLHSIIYMQTTAQSLAYSKLLLLLTLYICAFSYVFLSRVVSHFIHTAVLSQSVCCLWPRPQASSLFWLCSWFQSHVFKAICTYRRPGPLSCTPHVSHCLIQHLHFDVAAQTQPLKLTSCSPWKLLFPSQPTAAPSSQGLKLNTFEFSSTPLFLLHSTSSL